jgi:heme-degrading monooxygenase HmoA
MADDSRSDDPLARLPEPPYWAVIFTSRRTPDDVEGYSKMAELLEARSREQPGFLGLESVRDAAGVGITVSYWKDEESLRAWKRVAVHAGAQREGRARWYEDYELRVARVERAYSQASSPREGL